MHLSKHHGFGNDFLVALDERNGHALSIDGSDAVRWCERRRGIGADGLIHGASPSEAEAGRGIDVVMHLFNADGSRAEMSGNGIRCLGQAVARQRGLRAGSITVLTDGGVRALAVAPGDDARSVVVRVDMGTPAPGPVVPATVATSLAATHGTVDMGNPHLVVLSDDPDTVDVASDGPWLERQFPLGVNIEWIRAVDRANIVLRVWERGAGITEACGTGACAAAIEARRWGLVDDQVRVHMPGGSADVVIVDDATVTLTGPSAFIADVTDLEGRELTPDVRTDAVTRLAPPHDGAGNSTVTMVSP